MEPGEKLALLKSVKLLAGLPDERLAKLGEFLTPETLAHGATVFAEGSQGESLYFISRGHVRIAKRLRSDKDGEPSYKELAILGPGDCFGEMALIEARQRSADAIASGETVLLRLGREDLNRWLASDAGLAMGFFAQLVHMLSSRLRRSSNEMTLLYDLSNLLLEPLASAKELLDRVMPRVMAYFEGDWVAGAYVYNEFNAEMDLVETEGDYHSVKDALKVPLEPKRSDWIGEGTYQVIFPGKKRVMGFVVLHRAQPLDLEERNEYARTLTTTARLVTAALENIGYRTEEGLRARLKTNVQSSY